MELTYKVFLGDKGELLSLAQSESDQLQEFLKQLTLKNMNLEVEKQSLINEVEKLKEKIEEIKKENDNSNDILGKIVYNLEDENANL